MAAKCVVCDTDLHCKVEPCSHGESVAWYCPECVIAALRADLTAALAQLAAREGQVCAAREALLRAKEAMESAWYELDPGDGVIGDQFIRQNDMRKRIAIVEAALTSSSPCRHEEETKRLRKAVEWRSVYPTCTGYWWHCGPQGTKIRRVKMAPSGFPSGGDGPYDADTNESLWDIDGDWAGPICPPAELLRLAGGG